ncbi:phosphatase 2C-like domain-containing protein [Halteromyces radiatus]|uniref:phosphatase 2C-like domain-containing protein n=1 Tax=Halteromyces radiatus TaxID=101107 RepID=UPI00221EA057|nr:phosphatase 2C-like domain-containing protein [Halteromyces radiatus]KAI8093151.1 phosphatase 2C-like domain-containing protein [Halteromyces radiatus]
MGQTLSEPVTEKHTTEGQDHRVLYAASGMQGWRITMEDAHTTIPAYKDTKASFFAVFDGHGGSEVAKYSGEHLHHRIFNTDAFGENNMREALKQGYLGIDVDLRADPLFEHVPSGCTAVSALITKDYVLYVANAGDSRAVLCVDGHAIALSQDHKPTNEKETQRIKDAGGHVEFGRVNGNLALSRALGDFEFKQRDDLSPEEQAVTADPDITEHKITEKDDFLIIACDGIWDCMTNQEAVNFVRAGLSKKQTLAEICETMMDHCLADETDVGGYGCDNMTVIIVALLHGKSKQEWYDAMASSFVINSDIVPFEKKEPNEIVEGKGILSKKKKYSKLNIFFFLYR